jgi:hypothetical protein
MEIRMRCKARSKRSGEQCKKDAMLGREVCLAHGGRSPLGVASPNLKHGRSSKDLPTRLCPRYHEFIADRRYTELRDEVAVIDVLISQSLCALDTGDSSWFRKELHSTWKALEKVRRDGDAEEVARLLNDLGELIKTRYSSQGAEDDVVKLIGARKRLVESERKRRIEEQHMIAVEEVIVFAGAMVEAVRRNVADPHKAAAIAAELHALLEREGLSQN